MISSSEMWDFNYFNDETAHNFFQNKNGTNYMGVGIGKTHNRKKNEKQ